MKLGTGLAKCDNDDVVDVDGDVEDEGDND